jgi:asparagine synthase (glutamine-hydrolysing)
MCGIFATLSDDRPVHEDVVRSATAMLAHRGPDGHRSWISAGRRVAMGHARLAVMDIEGGHQPLASEDGQVRVVVNGEFYGHAAIRQRLQSAGHEFRTRSDSEIVVHLWEECGPGCLASLRGEFAFVLWDERQQTLFAARDRFGVKPLYYTESGGCLYLASEVKALFAAGVPARWDRESFYEMCHLYYAQHRTLYAGVRQVSPGHYLVATRAGVRLVKYWDLDYPRAGAAQPERTPGEHVLRLREALDEAVALRLQADVPVGCYLSGGLDSSLVLALAARRSSRPVDAFTVLFDDRSHDESSVAGEMARHAGARHHRLAVTQDDLADHFADSVWHSETVNPNTNGVAKYLLSRHVRNASYKVVLTGEGADETAAGYDFLVRDMLLFGGRGQVRRDRQQRALGGPGLPTGETAAASTAAVRRCLGFVPSWVAWFAEAAAHAHMLWSREFCTEFGGRDPYRGFLEGLDLQEQLADREPVNQSLYVWNKSMFVNLLLNQLSDRMEMAHGVEGRLPFLDGAVVDVLRETPLSMKIRGTRSKYVLREAARPYITDTVYCRRKQPFLAPPSPRQPAGRLHQMLQDLLRSQAMAAVPFFDHGAVVRFLDALPSLCARGPAAMAGADSHLVYLASACVLQARFHLAA